MPFNKVTLLLVDQFMKDGLEELTNPPEHLLATILGHEHDRVLLVSIGVRQALI